MDGAGRGEGDGGEHSLARYGWRGFSRQLRGENIFEHDARAVDAGVGSGEGLEKAAGHEGRRKKAHVADELVGHVLVTCRRVGG